MMSSTRASAPGVWMAGNSPDLRLSSCIPGIENDLRWRPTNGHSPSSNDPTVMKDDLPSSSSGFASKGMLDDESWYMAPENTLMDEMKELVGSQQQQQQQDNNSVSPAHFSTLDSSHLHGLFNRNNVSVSRSFSGLSSFLDTGMQFDGGLNNNNHRQGGGGGGNFLQQQLDNQSGAGLVSCSSGAGRILMPSLGPNVHSGNARGALLSNMSPRGTLQLDDGGGFNHHSTNLSNFLSSNGSFTTSVGGFSNHHHGLGAAGIGNGGFGDFQNNSLSRNLMAKDNNSLQLLNVERPPYLSKHLLSSSSPQKVVAPSTTTSTTPTPTPNPSSKPQTQTQQQKRGGTLRHAVSGGPISPSTVKSQSPRQVIASVSNDSSVNMPDEDMHMSPNGKLDIPGPSSVSKEDIDGKLTQAHAHAHAHPAGSGSDDGAGDHNMMDAEPRLDREEGKDDDDVEESGDGSGLYETEDMGMEGHGQGTALSLPGEKGKGKKGLPAKNLMAERRRRKKLNDRLYMLRSVVPKITKMDRASILGDAIEYLKELLDRINDLHNELGSTTSVDRPPNQQNNNTNPALHAALPQPSASTVTTCRVKEELPSSIASPDSQQQQQVPQIPLRVDVNMQMGERRALNIHMFCSKRPGLLLSTMRALDGLGLEVQQAVVSCFNGFALDVFRAEQLQEGEIGSEEVRSVLLHAAGANLGTLE